MFSISIEPWWRVLILRCFVFMLLCALFNNPTVKGNRGLFIVTNITNLMVFRFVHKII